MFFFSMFSCGCGCFLLIDDERWRCEDDEDNFVVFVQYEIEVSEINSKVNTHQNKTKQKMTRKEHTRKIQNNMNKMSERDFMLEVQARVSTREVSKRTLTQ